MLDFWADFADWGEIFISNDAQHAAEVEVHQTEQADSFHCYPLWIRQIKE